MIVEAIADHARHERLRTIATFLSALLLAAAPVVAPRGADAAGARPAGPADESAPTSDKLDLVEFQSAPFPYRGNNPGLNRPFLDVNANDRLGHNSVRGGVYWEDETYNDRRTLLFIPAGFRVDRPAVIIVFFHGNQATLERDVDGRQRVPAQIAGSGLNAVLVAPQFAVDALDSSPGHFWEPGAFRRYLDEAATHLARLYGDGKSGARFAGMPVVLAAYSGGYLPAAYSIASGGVDERLAGLILLDALYGEVDKFADWIAGHAGRCFFLSAYSNSSSEANAALQAILARRRIGFTLGVPDRLAPGSISFVKVDDTVAHNDFVTVAWTKDPLRDALSKVPGFEEEGPETAVASLTSSDQAAAASDSVRSGAPARIARSALLRPRNPQPRSP